MLKERFPETIVAVLRSLNHRVWYLDREIRQDNSLPRPEQKARRGTQGGPARKGEGGTDNPHGR